MQHASWIEEEHETAAGPVPKLSTRLGWRDRLGAFQARWMINRLRYFVTPGLYCVGSPDATAPVLVTANYKLTVDALRRELHGLDAWVLILDTKGINVWCAAGKGTFGTDELIHRLAVTSLAQRVNHPTLILPQLGAPGVAAYKVRQETGFRVVYGPVRASDLPEFLASGMKATADMRRVTFPLRQRLVLIPVELLTALKYAAAAALLALILGGIGHHGYSSSAAVAEGVRAVAYLSAGIGAGVILVPALLPWLPGRSFSLKGLTAGGMMVGGLVALFPDRLIRDAGMFTATAWVLMALAIASFAGMNFTGASTYTSLSGVRKEMRRAVPLQFAAAGIGLVLWIIGRFWSI